MRFKILVIITFLCCFSVFCQEKKVTYFQYDVAVHLKGNPKDNQNNPLIEENNSWFLPDGLATKFGFGVHKNKWIALGIHSGIDWKATEKLVAVPIFANFRLSPKVGAETRIFAQMGYGKTFAIGRGDLSGAYKKISLGIENADDISIFIELSEHNLQFNNFRKVNTVSLGIALTTF